MELVDALGGGSRSSPILIEDTPLPEAAALPEALRPLLGINVARIRRDPDFRRDASRAIHDITELARAEQQRRHAAAEAAAHEAEAERQRVAAEQAARDAAETERQRLEREAALATAEAVAAERRGDRGSPRTRTGRTDSRDPSARGRARGSPPGGGEGPIGRADRSPTGGRCRGRGGGRRVAANAQPRLPLPTTSPSLVRTWC